VEPLNAQVCVSGLAARPEWAAVDEPSGFELPTFSAYPKEYVTAVGEYLLTLPQQLEVLAGGPDDAAEDVTFFAASWLTKVSPSPSLPLCLPHCGSHCVSLTFSPTVSPSLWLSLCLPHLLSHCVSPTVALTVSPSHKVALGAAELYLAQLLRVPALTDKGAQQVCRRQQHKISKSPY
jgi:hypothetical protein